jgi:hypothetical protein
MKKHLTWLAALAVLGLAGTANAKPVKLTKAELDKVVAGWQGPPGQHPAGNPGHAPGNSNPPGGK